MARTRAGVWIGIAVVAAGLLAACGRGGISAEASKTSNGSSGSPLVAVTPRPQASCLDSTDGATPANSPPVFVDPNPIGAEISWIPGSSVTPCTPVINRADSAHAIALAKAIDAAPKSRYGVFNCPSDDRMRVRLYLLYAGNVSSQYAQVELSGCGGIDAPGRADRSGSAALNRALAALAPAGPGNWLGWLGAG